MTVIPWVTKFRDCDPGKVKVVNEARSRRPITFKDDKYRKHIHHLIKMFGE